MSDDGDRSPSWSSATPARRARRTGSGPSAGPLEAQSPYFSLSPQALALTHERLEGYDGLR